MDASLLLRTKALITAKRAVRELYAPSGVRTYKLKKVLDFWGILRLRCPHGFPIVKEMGPEHALGCPQIAVTPPILEHMARYPGKLNGRAVNMFQVQLASLPAWDFKPAVQQAPLRRAND